MNWTWELSESVSQLGIAFRQWIAVRQPSREAATECSPGRKPWVEVGNVQALKGRKKGAIQTLGRLSSRRCSKSRPHQLLQRNRTLSLFPRHHLLHVLRNHIYF